MAKRPLIIFGIRDFAELAFEYFTHDSDYEVVAFTVDQKYLVEKTYRGKPVVPFETIEQAYDPQQHYFYAALSYRNLNRNRAEKYLSFKQKGYKPASYISSHLFKWHNVELGEHNFIFEDNTLQPFVKIGNNNILWSGNHIGHGTIIHDNVFITSHVVVSGYCEIGDNTFLGVNSTLANDTKIGARCWVNHGAIMSGKIPDGSLVKSVRSEVGPLDEARLMEKLSTISQGRNYED
jgi:sugar O-acyltransferase (sialic acid O-acetyltransferase NeuD family)